MALTDPVPSQAIDVFKRNMEDSDRFMNQTSGTVTNRTGKTMRPLPVISDDIESQVIALEAEIVNVTDSAANAFGFRPVGLFADGFTLNYRNEVGIDGSGNSWIYSGTLPVTVTAGTVPSAPDYQQVTYNSLQSVTDLDKYSELNKTTRREVDLSTAKADDAPVGTLYTITDLDNAHYIVVSSGDSGGWYQTGLSSGRKLKHVLKDHYITLEELVPNVTDSTDCLSAYNYARTLDAKLLLQRLYGLSNSIDFYDNQIVEGLSRETTGFVALPAFDALSTRSLTNIAGDNVRLRNFKADAKNYGDAGAGRRYNAVSTSQDVKDFNVQSVDVYNCTGYGHVTFGSEANPQVTGVYFDCKGVNCQVPFEQIGALEVELYSCNAEAVAGRTIESFHPYAGSKKVTYVNCSVTGDGGAGVNIVTTNGYPVGPIKFINCDIDINTTTSAINIAKSSGADALVDVEFVGGSYKSNGASFVASCPLKFKSNGTKFDGKDGFNLPNAAAVAVDATMVDTHIRAEKNDAGATAIALITNGSTPRVLGGKIEAINSLGGSVPVSGSIASSFVEFIPASGGGNLLDILAEGTGEVAITPDGGNGFFNVPMPVNVTDSSKLQISAMLKNASDSYPVAHSFSWFLVDANTARVRVIGLNSGTFSYRYVVKN